MAFIPSGLADRAAKAAQRTRGTAAQKATAAEYTAKIIKKDANRKAPKQPLATPKTNKLPTNIGWDEGAPVSIQPVTDQPAVALPAEPQWTLEGDPVYQQALASGQAQFNYARNAALAEKQNTETAKAQERRALDVNAAENRRRTAGNYAARGMAGGAAGALTMAEARANAEQIAARTSIQDQIAALNQNFLANYGAIGSDWTGTLAGQQYKTQAAQAAITNRLAQYGVA